jgi:U3 small nucleolar ribonucleoprotein component
VARTLTKTKAADESGGSERTQKSQSRKTLRQRKAAQKESSEKHRKRRHVVKTLTKTKTALCIIANV